MVRNRIKAFAQKKVTLPAGRHKIIILDEADSMTPAAQQALRRTMEIYSSSTRFALACNQSSKIIEPIQSRCAILRYARLSDSDILKRLLEICAAEHVSRTLGMRPPSEADALCDQVQHSDEGLNALVFTSEGDMRQAINNLQSTFSGFGFVSPDAVFKVCDQPHPITVKALLRSCSQGHIEPALDQLDQLWRQGYSAVDIVTTLFRVVKGLDDLPEYLKLEFIKVSVAFHQPYVLTGSSVCRRSASHT